MATPSVFVDFHAKGGLSADGRCRSFARGASGTGWSEGVGLVLLERYSDALRRGRPIAALITGSAVNQDGASAGLTAPNGPSQQRVITEALADAGIAPDDIDVIEAHGTGTSLGDRIELQALGQVFRDRDRSLDRIRLGSLKSNVGHMQAAAGVGGLIKMCIALQRERVAPTLHVGQPTDEVNWDRFPLELVAGQPSPWPRSGRTRRGGVSSFGISGTNAHVIIEEVPRPADTSVFTAAAAATTAGDGDEVRVAALDHVFLPVSGHTPAAVEGGAARLVAVVSEEGADAELAGALLRQRSHLSHRAAVVTPGVGVADALRALADGRPHPGVVRGQAIRRPRLAVMFSGQGSQVPSMGLALSQHYPVFAERYADIADRFAEVGVDLAAIRRADGPLTDTSLVQPAIFAFHVAGYGLLESFGLEADVVLGHSIGEYAAAHVAGVLSLGDAVRLVARRGRLMQALPDDGEMFAVQATEEEVAALLVHREDSVAIAAVNAAHSVVVSGRAKAVAEIASTLAAGGRRTKRLAVGRAFHSPLVDGVLGEFAAAFEGVTLGRSRIPFVSTVTGLVAEPDLLSEPDYWVRQIRRPVRFLDAVTTAGTLASGLVEVSPLPVLGPLAAEVVMDRAESGPDITVSTTGSSDGDEIGALRTLLGTVWAAGFELDAEAVFGPDAGFRTLPRYAFDRRRYWAPDLFGPARTPGAGPVAAQLDTVGNPSAAASRPVALADLDGDERRAQARGTVLGLAAALLGHESGDGLDPSLTLLELGFDSVSAVTLRNLVFDQTGFHLPALAFDNTTTVESLTGHLLALVDGGGDPGGGSPSASESGTDPGPSDPVDRFRAAASGQEAVEVLDGLAGRSSTTANPIGRPAVVLRRGPAEPDVIAIPSVLPGSGAHQFARLAGRLTVDRFFSVLTLPGIDGGLVPDSWDGLARAMADASLEATSGRDAVLIGYSSGGAVALATAAELARRRRPPVGLVLLDVYDHRHEGAVEVLRSSLEIIQTIDEPFVTVTEAGLAASGEYIGLLGRYREVDTEQFAVLSIDAAHSLADVPRLITTEPRLVIDADHFSILGDEATVVGVERFIDSPSGHRPPIRSSVVPPPAVPPR